MHEGRLVFAQLMDFIPKRDFDECVKRYRGNYRVRDFSCRDQFLTMAFAQLTYRESLRDIETCLNAVPSKLYHAGFRGQVSRARSAMPTSVATGGSTPTSLKCSFVAPEPCTPRTTSQYRSNRPPMPWIPQLSIFVLPCFLGRDFVVTKVP